ncbi:hypothetical protein [Pandoraea sputorum]|uniref:hypothetical protein n=1 Tax=Pandoraea sputorum TaxID=93222 RepID=UPI00123EF38F|nr:hypothetical protein [Pandoraea sputorum]
MSQETLNVAKRAAQRRNARPVGRTELGASKPNDATTALEGAEQQARELAVFALFVAFERYVVEHLQTAHERLTSGYPSAYSRRLAEKFKSEVAYWRFDEVLDLFKPDVGTEKIGRVKQIKKYRDWIAHRNTRKEAPLHTTPDATYILLSDVAEKIGAIHNDVRHNPRAGPRFETIVCRDHLPFYRRA